MGATVMMSETVFDTFIATLGSRHTRRNYKRVIEELRAFLRERLGDEADRALLHAPLATLVPHLQEWAAGLASSGNKPATQHFYLNIANSLGMKLVELGIREGNPFHSRLVKRPPTVDYRDQHAPFLEAAQARALFDEIARAEPLLALRDRAMFGFMYCEGMRRDESCHLKFGQVTDDVTKARPLGKGAKRRTLSIDAGTRAALLGYWKADGRPWPQPADAFVFHSSTKPVAMHEDSVNKRLRYYCDRAGVPAVGPHSLRHSFVTLSLDAKRATLEELRVACGHASINQTARYQRRNESTVTLDL